MHRIGQTREVVVTRFVIADTVEERILALQERKRALAEGALHGSDKAQLRIEDLKMLFGDE